MKSLKTNMKNFLLFITFGVLLLGVSQVPYVSAVNYDEVDVTIGDGDGDTDTGSGSTVTQPPAPDPVISSTPALSSPVGVNAIAGSCDSGRISISWGVVQGATAYTLYDNFVQIYNGASASFNHDSLTPSSQHYYYVVANNSSGSSGNSIAALAQAPAICPSAALINNTSGNQTEITAAAESECFTFSKYTLGSTVEYCLEQAGYTCGITGYTSSRTAYSCSLPLNTYTYAATVPPSTSRTLQGLSTRDSRQVSFAMQSPFVYISNFISQFVSLTIDSPINTYLPIPAFNTKNGWSVVGNSEKQNFSLNGVEQEHLFYELAMNSITLSRNGVNFASKEELAVYLKYSDFLNKLGFTDVQKKNSLDYVLGKLAESPDAKYFYLTVLDDASVAEVSTLTIDPKPEKLFRDYFVIYPTNVPVTTEGSFVFPEKDRSDGGEFTVKETGEFLLTNDIVVFFK